MAKTVPQSTVSPAGAGTITIVELEPSYYYWWAIVYSWEFTAVPNQGYEFDHWEVNEIDRFGDQRHHNTPYNPPREINWFSSLDPTYQEDFGTTSLVAHFKASTPPVSDSAINLSLVSNPVGFGTLTGGGLKSGAVGSSVSFDVAAAVAAARQGTHRFSHWIDDEGVKYKTKQFSKTFTLKSGYTTSNPEQKTFTAYFVPYTKLILRSTNSGLILRGSNDKILRDE